MAKPKNNLENELISCLSKAVELIYVVDDHNENTPNKPSGYVFLFEKEDEMNDAILFFKEYEEELKLSHVIVIENKEDETAQLMFTPHNTNLSIMTTPVLCKKDQFDAGDDDSSIYRILWFGYLKNKKIIMDYPTEYVTCFTKFYFR